MEILLTLLLTLMRFLDFVTTPIYNYKAKNKRQYLPPLKNELLRVSATELASKIRNKLISSEEICQVYMDRIKDVNPILNAVVEERFRHVLKEAKQVDSYLQTTSLSVEELEKFKPLLGVPITVKESCGVKGMSLCTGVKSRLGIKAETDGETVARIRSCGAIVLLISTTPECVISWETFSFINGYTTNPYDTTCTSGGSSGGEGALLGAGASLIGIGSDILGSIRLPAAFNGVFGHKPTPRTTSIKGHWPIGEDDKYYDFLVIGPLVRYAPDLRLLMKVMCGNKLSADLKLDEPVDIGKLNIFFMEDIGIKMTVPRVSEDIKNAIQESVRYLKKTCGATVQDYKFKDFNKCLEVCVSTVCGIKDIPNVFKEEKTHYFLELVKSLFRKSDFTPNLIFFHFIETIFRYVVSDYSEENEKLKKLVLEKLGSNGILLMPVHTQTAHKHHQFYFKNGYPFMAISNALGLPATSVPCGFDKNGMPVGIQVMAAPYQDRLCLAVAEELERHFGGWIPPPEKGEY